MDFVTILILLVAAVVAAGFAAKFLLHNRPAGKSRITDGLEVLARNTRRRPKRTKKSGCNPEIVADTLLQPETESSGKPQHEREPQQKPTRAKVSQKNQAETSAVTVIPPELQDTRPVLTPEQIAKLKVENDRALALYRKEVEKLTVIRRARAELVLSENSFATVRDLYDDDDLVEIVDLTDVDIRDIKQTVMEAIADVRRQIGEESETKGPKMPSASGTSANIPQYKKAIIVAGHRGDDDETEWQTVKSKYSVSRPKAAFTTERSGSTLVGKNNWGERAEESQEFCSAFKEDAIHRLSGDDHEWTPEGLVDGQGDAQGARKKARRRQKPQQKYIPGLNYI